MTTVSQIAGGVPVTSGNGYYIITDNTSGGTSGGTWITPTSTTTYNIPTQWLTASNRTQILPGVYLNHDEHKLERG